jgi:hypothetical protein
MRNIVLIALFFLVACSDAASHSSQPETQTPKSSASKTPGAVQTSSSAQTEAPVKLKIHVNDTTFTATLEENSSAKAFAEFLAQGDMTLDMHDYGSFEKVAELPISFPRNDTQIDTDAGDIILYQGKSITIYYDKNSWSFTRLGKIDNVDKIRLKQILGNGNATVTFSVK